MTKEKELTSLLSSALEGAMKDINNLVRVMLSLLFPIYALAIAAVASYFIGGFIWLALQRFGPELFFSSLACLLCFGWGLAAGQKHPKK